MAVPALKYRNSEKRERADVREDVEHGKADLRRADARRDGQAGRRDETAERTQKSERKQRGAHKAVQFAFGNENFSDHFAFPR